jgi:hypothetical protein
MAATAASFPFQFLKQKRIETQWLYHHQNIGGFTAVSLEWADQNDISFLKIAYGDQRGILIFRGQPVLSGEACVVDMTRPLPARTLVMTGRRTETKNLKPRLNPGNRDDTIALLSG